MTTDATAPLMDRVNQLETEARARLKEADSLRDEIVGKGLVEQARAWVDVLAEKGFCAEELSLWSELIGAHEDARRWKWERAGGIQ